MQDFNEEQHISEEQFVEERPRKSRLRRFFLSFIILAVLCGAIGIFAFKTGFTFSQITVDNNGGGKLPIEQPIKEKDPDRVNILLLGLRGEGDPHGGLLTDSLMLVSIKKSTGQVALLSIPRDLYVKIPGTEIHEKINAVYAYGEKMKQGSGGMLYSKVIISEVTGLYIDYAVSVNFEAFKEAIDAIGGVDVYLDKPFVENQQFTNEIILNLPAGKNHLDGETALFYVRSRYTTSDFDRMRRQQQVLVAVKDKSLSLGVLANPVKIFNLLDVLGRNVRTDMGMGEIQEMIRLASNVNADKISKKVFDTSQEGLLYSSHGTNGAYILLPVGGNYEKMREACRNIFQ
jgi:LCP family protein required for cell wall assembly